MGAGGKGSKFVFRLLYYCRITVAGVYLGIIRQYKNLFGYGFDYLTEISR